MLKRTDINIRDPFVLPWEGKYYLYGTRGSTAFNKLAYGIDVFVSDDLENWDGPHEVFRKTDDFWADHCFWAPEVHVYGGRFIMLATFAVGEGRMGTSSLCADSPMGPFKSMQPGTLTPEKWMCLDGTLYVSPSGEPYLVFCHEWTQIGDGEVCAVRLNADLSAAEGEPVTLFRARDGAPNIKPIREGCWVTDGPFMLRTADGRLHMLWSSFGEGGYVQALAHSDNDDVTGHWTVDDRLLFDHDGGHGMIFRTFDGRTMLTLHSPNRGGEERPVFIGIGYENGRLVGV